MDGKSYTDTDPSEPGGCSGNNHKTKLSKNNSCLRQATLVLKARQAEKTIFRAFLHSMDEILQIHIVSPVHHLCFRSPLLSAI
jgi:hypothetical protein